MEHKLVAKGERLTNQVRNRRLLGALLAGLLISLGGLMSAASAQASTEADAHLQPVNATAQHAHVQAPTVSVAPMATTRVCSPSGKCVNASRVCNPGQCGQKSVFKEWPKGQYCAPSVGCFTYKGVNYSYTGAPKPTPEQQAKITQCAANLGFAWVTAVAGGPVGFTIGGVALAVWGCAS
jgi:hypothetical protein